MYSCKISFIIATITTNSKSPLTFAITWLRKYIIQDLHPNGNQQPSTFFFLRKMNFKCIEQLSTFEVLSVITFLVNIKTKKSGDFDGYSVRICMLMFAIIKKSSKTHISLCSSQVIITNLSSIYMSLHKSNTFAHYYHHTANTVTMPPLCNIFSHDLWFPSIICPWMK